MSIIYYLYICHKIIEIIITYLAVTVNVCSHGLNWTFQKSFSVSIAQNKFLKHNKLFWSAACKKEALLCKASFLHGALKIVVLTPHSAVPPSPRRRGFRRGEIRRL